MFLPDRSSQDKFGSLSSEERVQHWPNRSLDRFSRSRFVLGEMRVDCNPPSVLALAGV